MFLQVKILLKRFGIALFFASVCRILFFVFNPYFHQFEVFALLQAFAYGVLYDISALVYMQSIFILVHLVPFKWFEKKWVQNVLFTWFVLAEFFFFFFNFMDTGYFAVAGKRSGIEIFAMGKEADGLVLQYLADYWYLLVSLLGVFGLSIWAYLKTSIGVGSNQTEPIKWLPEIGWRIVLAGAAFVGARGGFNLMPLNTFDAARQTQPELISLVVNTPFNMIISTQQTGLIEQEYMTKQEADKWFNPIQQHQYADSNRPNIVVLLIESLGKEYIGYYNNGKGYTPFLDSLMGHSSVYMHAYSNGKKSIEGIPAALASMPSWMQAPYLSSFYQGNALTGIGGYLQAEGYDASFYHGGKNGTMSFDNFIALSKGGSYYGKNEYPNTADFDGHWGIFDGPYLQYFGRQLGVKKEPFFSTVFTLTSHHPFQVPVGMENKFPAGTLPIHRTIGYVDDALRNFFSYAKTQSWYNNTVFVLTADHSAENERAYYQSAQGKFEIPLFVFRPDSAVGIENNSTISHVDILPLILQEAHVTKPYFSFGALGQNKIQSGLAMQYHDQFYQLIEWPYVYHFDGVNPMAFYSLDTDTLLKKNKLTVPVYASKIDSMDKTLKAIIQTYNQRVIHNKTQVE
ncbi:MAG: hypothetical protein CFE21_15650 [Bacteroidetes bacterium B1(2017)]|nr:MAG: hypothetical protein CFE21_15650 [Bacteroidetes bacterium B1(2017)]